MTFLRAILVLLSLSVLASCGSNKFQTYNGPEVTRVVVLKSARQVQLWHHDRVLKAYKAGLGFAPEGHKYREGDGRTPEGTYMIDRRNPKSQFHLSIGVSYPNLADRKRADLMGFAPGGDIFIHGRGKTYKPDAPFDWTAGCIAVTDEEIEEIYAMVKDGTPISILP
ncbi:hypothetical protein E2L08_11750 [Palleronia sediminis]|uniref:L,D-TPase catalytic domain-containing protein n=1 Tax=Palleronia sediminis TaxID=2547833 RepID=A0A4R6A5Y5_9RHOB|nr:L,D-transpeptidase family protein [Palleronia sediminis]TDL78162.1 hypothetical protein E2L08_11750 [Palleronia sediminis]